MGKEAGYVYFEADCTSNGLNPFVPLDSANPTLIAFQQKPLKVFNKNRNKQKQNIKNHYVSNFLGDCFLSSKVKLFKVEVIVMLH